MKKPKMSALSLAASVMGRKGGPARMASMTPAEFIAHQRNAANARWNKKAKKRAA